MKYIISFNKFTLNEMFDDDFIKYKNEIAYLSNSIDKKELLKPSKLFTNRIHNLILSKIPFFKKATTEIFPDMVIYRFGNKEKTLVFVIEGHLINDTYHKNGFQINVYIEKNGECLNPNDVGDVYDIHQILDFLNGFIPYIEKDFDVTNKQILN